MNKLKKMLICFAGTAWLLAVILTSPLYPQIKSVAVMSAFSSYNVKSSVQKSQEIELKIPSGAGWYPFVMTFNADTDFAAVTGIPGARLSILYNFPAFDMSRGCSRLFDEASPYYSSFYGAYLVKLPDGSSYGFEPYGESLEDAVVTVAKLDYFRLVLEDFCLPEKDKVFKHRIESVTEDLDFVGSGDWTRLRAEMLVNGASHNARRGVQSYLQYGRPGYESAHEFAPVNMKCEVYAKYFNEYETTVFFYAMSQSGEVLESCVDDILSKSVLR